MGPTSLRRLGLAILIATVIAPGAAQAQLPTIAPEVRDAALARVKSDFAAQLASATTDAGKQAVYRRMFEALIANEGLYPRLTVEEYRTRIAADSQLFTQRVVGTGRQLRESAVAVSTTAALSNPAATQLVERSASTELLALAADLRQLFSADRSAITLNLNALGLFRGSSSKDVDAGAQYLYSQREHWRRLTGSVTFGAKIPEKELTGISGVPAADELFDAIAWDVKFRLIGDRDPRAGHWYGLFIDRLGTVNELTALVLAHPTLVPGADLAPAQAAALELQGESLGVAARHVSNSLVVSIKMSGQHLTRESGRNRFIAGVMLDKGFADLDFTANATFSAADAPAIDGADPFRTRNWQLAAAVTGSVLKDALVKGRAAELSASVSGVIPMGDDGIAVHRERILKVNTMLTLPFMDKAKIPLSFTYANDPNNLTKEQYVTGQIGVSYDFGAIWSAFK